MPASDSEVALATHDLRNHNDVNFNIQADALFQALWRQVLTLQNRVRDIEDEIGALYESSIHH